MTKIYKIKDKFFKVVLGDERNMKPVLRFILPEPIKRSMDWSQITIEPTNAVSKRYREGYSARYSSFGSSGAFWVRRRMRRM